MSEVENWKTFSFWAGGHIVYFQTVFVSNFVLLRATHNFTGWNELLIFLQVTSYFWILYLDSIILTKGPIAYFFDEFMSSWTAWLGCILIACLLVVEKAILDAYDLMRYKNLG